jgi:hypothetical protein
VRPEPTAGRLPGSQVSPLDSDVRRQWRPPSAPGLLILGSSFMSSFHCLRNRTTATLRAADGVSTHSSVGAGGAKRTDGARGPRDEDGGIVAPCETNPRRPGPGAERTERGIGRSGRSLPPRRPDSERTERGNGGSGKSLPRDRAGTERTDGDGVVAKTNPIRARGAAKTNPIRGAGGSGRGNGRWIEDAGCWDVAAGAGTGGTGHIDRVRNEPNGALGKVGGVCGRCDAGAERTERGIGKNGRVVRTGRRRRGTNRTTTRGAGRRARLARNEPNGRAGEISRSQGNARCFMLGRSQG